MSLHVLKVSAAVSSLHVAAAPVYECGWFTWIRPIIFRRQNERIGEIHGIHSHSLSCTPLCAL
jgi:hypothetical protein